jgi:hypothetical protein
MASELKHLSLEDLLSDGFLADIGIVSSAKTLRRCLTNSAYVDGLRRAIAGGAIREETIRRFCDELMVDFERNVRFPHEYALAALAVALEDRKTDFVEEFLLDLARLNIVEMPFAPEVARGSLNHWRKLPRARTRTSAPFGQAKISVSFQRYWAQRARYVSVRNRIAVKKFSDAAT